jgi:hypothetical protein
VGLRYRHTDGDGERKQIKHLWIRVGAGRQMEKIRDYEHRLKPSFLTMYLKHSWTNSLKHRLKV